jgi:2-dehydro-3-deoxyphosphooctonate aldolase (KDO 8-P synthase)
MAFRTAEHLIEICNNLGIQYIFKASFDKANRMSIDSERGVGLAEGLKILREIREELAVPVITDVHEGWQAEVVGSVVDVMQIPAFLCRQTDLLVAVGRIGKPVNIKKGQFMNPADMKYAAEKIESSGNDMVLLTERGSSFGYGDIVLDPRSIVIMMELGYPVVLDVTHTTQRPGSAGGKTGGDRKFTPYFVKVGVALGVETFFMEIHPDPANAISDAQSQIPLNEAKDVIGLITK